METYIIYERADVDFSPNKSMLKMGIEIESIKHWLLELNNSGKPIREIAIGSNDEVLCIAPYETEHGLWSDSDILIDKPEEYENIPLTVFQNLWEDYTKRTE